MSENINQAHRDTTGASQTYRLMSYLQHDNLPKGAVSLIETMCRGTDEDLENAYELNTPAVLWGRDHEVEAVELIAAELGCEIRFYGDNQKRFFAGEDYSNFISALPDAIGIIDHEIFTIEVKCLDTKNHDYIIQVVGDNAGVLMREDWAKYCQVQTQNICAEQYYEKPVSSIVVFYDPRSEIKKLHYIVVVDGEDSSTIDHDFRNKLKQRAKLARNLYDSIKAEPDRAAVVYDGVMPETKLVQAATDIITIELLELGLEAVITTVADKYGVKIAGDKLVGGDVFLCETQAGRDMYKPFKREITKIRTTGEKLLDPLYREKLEAYQSALKVKQGFTNGINAIRDHILQPLAEWEHEQKIIQDVILEAEAEKQRLAAEQAEKVRQAILAKMQIFTVLPMDSATLESVAERRAQIESTIVDALYGEFEAQAHEAKAHAIEYLLHLEDDLKQEIIDNKIQGQLDAFNSFTAKCEALSDPLHSVEYLESQRFKLFNAPMVSDSYGANAANAAILKLATLGKLDNELIPAAKQWAVDLAEKLKAEAEQKRLADEKTNTVECEPVAVYEVEVNPLVPELLPEKILESVDRIERENSLEHDIIAIYAALNPVLHTKVVEAASKVGEYHASEQKASFLHNLFDNSKQGKELKAAFIQLVK